MDKKIKKIIVFPGGSEVGLEIFRSLKDCKDIKLFSCNSGVPNHSSFVYEYNCLISDIWGEEWIGELNRYIEVNEIDCIYPAHDDVLLALSENREKICTKIILPSKETCRITRSKRETYEKLKNDILVPEIISNQSNAIWPLFLKPDKGQGSKNAYVIKDKEEMDFYLNHNENMIVLEYLPGKEFTVDCFSNNNFEIMFCGGRERIRTRNGISVNSKIVKDHIFDEYAKKISSKLKINGAWFFQVKKDKNGKLKLLEVAPRISGTMSVFRTLGVNFPLLSIYQKFGIDVEILLNDYTVEVSRALESRYKHDLKYDSVYIDFDDTIIFDNKVNCDIINFIYQCRNNKKKLILITKSVKDINAELKKYCISENLFDEVIHIDKNENKADFINSNFSIFIDDSFSERAKVAKNNIPTFDSSMIELLIDDKK